MDDEFLSTFDGQITTLFSIIGAMVPQHQLTNAHIAHLLQIEPSNVTARRKGKPALQPGEAAKIVYGYQLNTYGITDELFQITDLKEFRAELARKGVGVYARTRIVELAAKLDERMDRSGALAIEMRSQLSQRVRRGLTYGAGGGRPAYQFRVDEPVSISVTGASGQHVAILERTLGQSHLLKTLSPTDAFPETLLAGGRIELAGTASESIIRAIQPTGPHWLQAVEGPEEFVRLFGQLDPGLPRAEEFSLRAMRPVDVFDRTASLVLEALERLPPGLVRTTALEFFVI